MLTDLQRQDRNADGPDWFVRLIHFYRNVWFLLRHRKVIQIAAVPTGQDGRFKVEIRFSGLDADEVEFALRDYLEHVAHEKANLQMVRGILNNTN